MKNKKDKLTLKSKLVRIQKFLETGRNLILLLGAIIALCVSFVQIISKKEKD